MLKPYDPNNKTILHYSITIKDEGSIEKYDLYHDLQDRIEVLQSKNKDFRVYADFTDFTYKELYF